MFSGRLQGFIPQTLTHVPNLTMHTVWQQTSLTPRLFVQVTKNFIWYLRQVRDVELHFLAGSLRRRDFGVPLHIVFSRVLHALNYNSSNLLQIKAQSIAALSAEGGTFSALINNRQEMQRTVLRIVYIMEKTKGKANLVPEFQ
jgi:hypothetical protein